MQQLPSQGGEDCSNPSSVLYKIFTSKGYYSSH